MDGSINFDTKLNINTLTADLKLVKQQINSLVKELEKIKLPDASVDELNANLEIAKRKIRELNELKSQMGDAFANSDIKVISPEGYERTQKAGSLLEEYKQEEAQLLKQLSLIGKQKDLQEQLNSKLGEQSKLEEKIAEEKAKSKKSDQEEKETKKAGFSGGGTTLSKKSISGLTKQFTSLGRILTGRLKRMLINGVFNGISAGFQSLLKFSPSLTSSYNSLMNSLTQLGANIVSTFEPIMQTVMPALAKLIDFLNEASSVAQMFFAKLSGQSYITKAIKGQKDFTKQTNKTLAGFDELNNIGGSSTSDSDTQFVKEFFDDNTLSSRITAIIEQIKSAYTTAISYIKNLLSSIDWYEAGKTIGDFIRSIDWGQVVSDVFYIVGQAIGGGLSLIIGFLDGLLADLKAYFEETFAPMFDEEGQFCMDGFLMGIVQVLVDIGTWIYDHIFKPFIEGFKSAFDIHSPSQVMVEMGQYVMQGFLNGITSLFNSIGTTISNLKTLVINKFTQIKTGLVNIWNGIWTAIRSILNKIIGGIESMVNRCIDGINSLTSGLRSIGNSALRALGISSFSINPIGHVSLPRLATGTNYVPENMVAMLHKGEAVVPKKYNDGNEETNNLLRQLINLVDSKEFKTYISSNDIGKASVNYINTQSRILGGSLV